MILLASGDANILRRWSEVLAGTMQFAQVDNLRMQCFSLSKSRLTLCWRVVIGGTFIRGIKHLYFNRFFTTAGQNQSGGGHHPPPDGEKAPGNVTVFDATDPGAPVLIGSTPMSGCATSSSPA